MKDLFKMSNETYDILKFVAQIVLPATGTLYGALSSIWGLPLGDEVVKTIVAIDAFMGAVLMISNHYYED